MLAPVLAASLPLVCGGRLAPPTAERRQAADPSAAGILVRDARVERGRVVVEVVTAREDHATCFRARYGAPSVPCRRHQCV